MYRVKLLDVLMEYVAEGKIEKVVEIIDGEPDLNKLCHNGSSMLHHAAEHGRYELTELLISRGHTINWKDEAKGFTPIHYAVINGHERIIKMLMLNRGDISSIDNKGKAPLHYAAEKGYTNIVDLLLSKGRSKIIAMILRNGADITHQDFYGKTALHYAAINGHYDCVELLLSNKYLNIAGRLITKGIEVDIEDHDKYTSLNYASMHGHFGICKHLISEGANLEHMNAVSETSIFLAAKNGHTQIVAYLIKLGANFRFKNHEGYTPFLVAAKNKHSDIVKLLIRIGNNTKEYSNNGNNALMEAGINGSIGIAKLLIESGCDCDDYNENGDTAFIIAARSGFLTLMKLLLEKNIDVRTRNATKETAFFAAAQNGHVEAVRLIISKYKNFNNDALTCKKALIASAKNGHLGVVELLLDIGINIQSKNIAGDTALHLAALYGNEEVVKLLIERGANISDQNKIGETPLHKAASCGKSTRSVMHLLDNGAKMDQKDFYGKTPLTIATRKSQFNVFEIILKDEPNNHKIREAMLKSAKQVSPNLVKILETPKKRLRGLDFNKNKSENTNTEIKRHSVIKILKSKLANKYFSDYTDLSNDIERYYHTRDYRIQLILRWMSLVIVAKFSPNRLSNYLLKISLFFDENNEKGFLKLVEKRTLNHYSKNIYFNSENNSYFEIDYEYDVIKRSIENFDKYVAPYIEHLLVNNSNNKHIAHSKSTDKRISKISSLKNLSYEELQEKYSTYELRLNKLQTSDFYQTLNKIKIELYRYHYIAEELKINKSNPKFEEIENEKKTLEIKYKAIRRNEYIDLIKQYEEIQEKIELCITCMNYIEFIKKNASKY